jgi:hypothetical protein
MMRADRLALTFVLFLPLAAGVRAAQERSAPQGPSSSPAGKPAPPPSQPAPTSAEAMGVSLKAIRKQLQQTPEPAPARASGSGLRYDFFVDVLGKRPPIDFVRDFDLSTKGAVRWGTPTHQEILNAMSPYWVNQGRPAGSGIDVLAVGRKK